MNRLQKKCAIASAGFHLLLLLILFIGPAFLSSRNPTDLPVVEFIPSRLIDAPFVGGGNPNAAPPPPAPQPPVAQPPPPTPQPPPPKIAQPEPPKPAPKDVKSSPEALETKAENKSRRPAVNTNLVVRPRDDAAASKQLAQANAQAEALANARRQAAAAAVGNAVANLRGGLSSSTTVELLGPGGGGETYASYDAYIRTVYMQAWVEPEGVGDNLATPKASVTIARDGTVISARLVESSNNAVVDRAVWATLNRVKFIAPFPEGSKDQQRTYTINFKLQPKKLL